ncbi:EamA family transporter [Erwinia sorbitola]|uniref:EamA family transporter n=1 Tax=Erwinia sorbitola TaxID=2681984 RepID=A0A6I6ESK0_9GAMM|nr:EamA family transporter [Erwinia sorbitola]MTD26237.1 EamA family transporter [Erwinia sorbitola]QGU87233.1 EamA family transporter [Erwinia sorbitola]
MSQLTLILWLLNVLVDTCGQLSFKAATRHSGQSSSLTWWRYMLCHGWIWLGVGCYVLQFVLWLAFLSLVPLSVGVMLGAISVVVIMIAGRLWFKERLSKWRIIGILLIALGVVAVGME